MKLSKIKYFDIFFKYQKEDLEKIVFTNDMYNEKVSFDIAIVFGGVSMIPHRLDAAINLYNNKKAKKILVSGGIGFLSLDRRNREAHKMQEYLLNKGVDSKDIIIEDKSRNTYENIIMSSNILSEAYPLNKTKTILITSDFHLKRCMELMQKNTSVKDPYGIGIKDGKNDLDNWYSHFKGRKNIRVEAILLCYYAKRGKIADLEIEM